MSDYYDLGSYRRPVTTASPEAQTWFDRGLLWCYGFNHEEAVRCFERAAEADPGCAMAYWGIAYAVGPQLQQGTGTRSRTTSWRQAVCPCARRGRAGAGAERALRSLSSAR